MKHVTICLFACILSLSLSSSSVLAQVGTTTVNQSGQVVTTITPTRTAARPALVQPGIQPPSIDRVIPVHESKVDIFSRIQGQATGPSGDGALQTTQGALRVPTIIGGFEGLGINGFLPPDSNGGIGINHYFEWINVQFAIYNRAGALQFGPVAGNTMFTGMTGPCETTNDGDPVVLFDQLVSRWFVSQFAVSGGANSLCIAISSGSDPTTSTWFLYEYNFGAVFPDYEKYGIWDDMYTMSFHGFTGGFVGLTVGGFDRTAMLASNPAATLQFFNADTQLAGDFFGGLPPRIQGLNNVVAGTPAPFVHMASNEGFGGVDRYSILSLDVDFVTPANTTLGRTDLAAAAFDQNLCGFARNCIPQPGTAVGLDSFGGNTLFQAPVRDLDPTAAVDLRLLAQAPVDVDGADLAGIRWIELQNTGGGWGIRQESTFSPADGIHRWMGSIAMNGTGDIAMAYSASDGIATLPAIWATGRLAADPLNMMTQGETVLRAGVGVQLSASSRWGDYAVLNVDPVDDMSFWNINEYITGGGVWGTYISHFSLRQVLPVELVSFDVIAEGNQAVLSWETASETQNAGFEVEQDRAHLTDWRSLGFVNGAGTTTETQHYTYRTEALEPGRHNFRLKQIDLDGRFEYSPHLEAVMTPPNGFHLTEAYPNPFNPSSRFTLTLSRDQNVRVELFTVLGERVSVLQSGLLVGNEQHSITIDGTGLPSGVYLYRVQGETFSETRSVALMK